MNIKPLSLGFVMTLSVLFGSGLNAAPKTEYLHPDHIGRTVMITDTSEQVLWKADYKPFGEVEVLYDPNGWGDQFGFPGQYHDAESGLYYNYYRDYDPTLGRYIQSDPIGITKNFSDPQLQLALLHGLDINQGLNSDGFGLNHNYGYSEQNPINKDDPFGLMPGMGTFKHYFTKQTGFEESSGNSKEYKECMSQQITEVCFSPLTKSASFFSAGNSTLICTMIVTTFDTKCEEEEKKRNCQ